MMGTGKSVAVIANAIDAAPVDIRLGGVKREFDALEELGLSAEELDLRDYFSQPDKLTKALLRFDAAWLRGGNTFMLRYALSMSHGDRALIQLLERDQIVVAGYSAGSCVLGPDLKGLELVDSPDEVTVRYGSAPIYEGMHVLPYAIAPHFRSPEHPETEAIDNLVDYYLDHGVAFRTLKDGEVLVVKGQSADLFA